MQTFWACLKCPSIALPWVNLVKTWVQRVRRGKWFNPQCSAVWNRCEVLLFKKKQKCVDVAMFTPLTGNFSIVCQTQSWVTLFTSFWFVSPFCWKRFPASPSLISRIQSLLRNVWQNTIWPAPTSIHQPASCATW